MRTQQTLPYLIDQSQCHQYWNMQHILTCYKAYGRLNIILMFSLYKKVYILTQFDKKQTNSKSNVIVNASKCLNQETHKKGQRCSRSETGKT